MTEKNMKRTLFLKIIFIIIFHFPIYPKNSENSEIEDRENEFNSTDEKPQLQDRKKISDDGSSIANGSKETKSNFQLIIRKQRTTIESYESQRFNEFFPNYVGRANNKSNNMYYGIRQEKKEWGANLEYNFFEIHKPNLSKYSPYCFQSQCISAPRRIGSYYRANAEINILKNIYSDKISIGGGLRHIQSSLDLNYPFSWVVRMGARFLGPQISFRFKTPQLYGLFLSGKIDYFYMLGKMKFETDEIYGGVYYGTDGRIIDSRTSAESRGAEIGLAINWSISESVTASFGFDTLNARIKPKSKDTVSSVPYDFREDIFHNIRARQLGELYHDRLWTEYFQVTLKL